MRLDRIYLGLVLGLVAGQLHPLQSRADVGQPLPTEETAEEDSLVVEEIPADEEPGEAAEVAESEETSQADEEDYADSSVGFWDMALANYYAILYGPGLKDGSSYQPTASGAPNRENPVHIKNYLSLGYALDSSVAFTGTAYWQYTPVQGRGVTWKDPYLKVSHDHLFQAGDFNLYGDLRFHFPISTESRNQDMLAGVQSFQVISFEPGSGSWIFGLYGSERINLFGGQGNGNDLELYLGPNLAYKFSDSLAFTLLYEMGASHVYGDRPFVFVNDGTDLQPGLSWDITPSLNLNPYLNLYTGSRVSLRSTSVGMTLNWNIY